MEVIGGAPLYGDKIVERVVPLVRRDIEVFERWIAEGKIAPINATHLLFAIWAMTQSYADFAAQMALVPGRKALTRKDFQEGERMIADIALAAVAVPSGKMASAIPSLVGALLAAILDFINLLSLPRGIKQIGLIHMTINLTVVVLYAINAYLRSRRPAESLILLSAISIGLLTISGWLGGKMVYVHRVAVEIPPEPTS
jgi:uncharacterized membrane protein